MVWPSQRITEMTRRRYTAAEREAMILAAGGICHLCQMAILAGEDWEASHVDIPARHGGHQVAPAHYRCHRVHTAEVTAPLIAKTRRQRQKHLGAFQTRAKLPCGRRASRSKGLSGEVKPRITGPEREAALREQSLWLDWSRPPIARQMVEETP